ncbi:Protein alcS [Cladobotryum mycophilum]|uniref:Protein alcS n=1 Tax=Cladobotryum mycophilum TaxID=491253 RepID=A0ABR0T075_9HYPO
MSSEGVNSTIMAEEKGTRHYDEDSDRMEAIKQFRTAASVNMTPELFEKLYLAPQTSVKGDLRRTFANPTPIAIVGFLLSLTPLSCDLMGWRGAGGNGAASIAVYFFQGGILMFVGGLLEWVLGNTFPAVVFLSFGTFWLSYAGTLNPSFAAISSYAPPDAKSGAEGAITQGYNASIGFWFLFMGVLCFIYFICSLRTNVAFAVIFLSLVVAFALLTGGFWALAADYTGNAAYAGKLIVGAGASLFVTCISGWWLLTAILLAELRFPISLPVGDLSNVIKPRRDD